MTRFGPGYRRPDPPPGCTGIEAAILHHGDGVAVVELAFGPHGDMWEHSAGFPILCVVLEGQGRMRLGGQEVEVAAGQCHRWPAGVAHKLWTDGQPLRTLMIELADR